MTETAARYEVEVDTYLAEAYKALAKARQSLDWASGSLRRSVGQTRRRGNTWSGTLDEAVETASAFPVDASAHKLKPLSDYRDAAAAVDDAVARVERWNTLYTGWSRFFLVTNTNGHIHSSMNCSTCFPSTQFAWLPTLSGLTEADAVADQGEILCSVCFPSAPSEWTTSVAKATLAEREVRAAAKPNATPRRPPSRSGSSCGSAGGTTGSRPSPPPRRG